LQGGRLWLMGGGAARASLFENNAPQTPIDVFSSALGELGSGRMMFDSAHWRSQITMRLAEAATRSPRAVGGWPGAPDYLQLPEELAVKTPDTDPIPPLRTAGFYGERYTAEFLSKPNGVVEIDP